MSRSTRNAIVYCRISDDSTGVAAGVDRQQLDCARLAEQHGWNVVGTIVDNDISASRYAKRVRPGYRRVLEALDSGRADTIVAWHLDRLWRQPRELEDLIDRAEEGVATIATVTGEIDLQTADGRFTARILVSVAAKASDDTRARVRRATDARAAQGVPNGGSRAFGYRADGVTIVEPEADAIREAATRVLTGTQLATIAREWNASGLRTPKLETLWAGPSVRKVLTNPRHAALRVHRGEIVGEATWPPILPPETHEALTAHYRAHTTPGARPRSLLTPLLRCGNCGEVMNRSTGGAKRGAAMYRCKIAPNREACGRVSIQAEPIEAWTAEAVLARLSSRAFALALSKQPTTAAPMREITKLERRADQLATAFAKGEITRRQLSTASAEIERQLGTLRDQVAESTSSRALADLPNGDPAAWWADLTTDRKRAVIASLIERIDVAVSDSARASDPNVARLTIRWKA